MSTPGDEAAIREALYVYWCPQCKRQTTQPWHTIKGAPLIPQTDEEHECERIEVVPVAALTAAQRERDARRERLIALQECEERERALAAQVEAAQRERDSLEEQNEYLAATCAKHWRMVESLRAALEQIAAVKADRAFDNAESQVRNMANLARAALRVDPAEGES